MIRRVAPLLAIVLAACVSGGSAVEIAPLSRAEFPLLLAQASQEAGAGRFGVADKMLTDFSTKYPASGEAAESNYWRAIYKLDPTNSGGSPHDAVALLDSYVSNPSAAHRSEAMTLRRIASALESRAAATQTSPTRTAGEPAGDKGKDDEIARLTTELAKANAELDRIKRRLAQPTKP